MPENKHRMPVCIVTGAILAIACWTAGAFASHVKELNCVTSCSSISMISREETSGLAFPVERKGGIVDPEPVLKPSSPELVVRTLNPDYDYVPSGAPTQDSQLSPELDCSTDIILAVFFKSRHCKTGTLVVIATSELADEANLELIEYGRMKWDGKSRMWFIKVPYVDTNPEIVTVAGAECLTDAPVLTMPHGCDARIPLDLGDDS